MTFSMLRYARLAALGALGVSAGALGLYLVIAVGSSPSARGGIDNTHATLAWISAAVPFAAIIAAHIGYAVRLLRYARENQQQPRV
jgi:hypothetical protein